MRLLIIHFEYIDEMTIEIEKTEVNHEFSCFIQ